MPSKGAWLLLFALLVGSLPQVVAAKVEPICAGGKTQLPQQEARSIPMTPQTPAQVKQYLKGISCANACYDVQVVFSVSGMRLGVQLQTINRCAPASMSNPTGLDPALSAPPRGCGAGQRKPEGTVIKPDRTKEGPKSRCDGKLTDGLDEAVDKLSQKMLSGQRLTADDLKDAFATVAAAETVTSPISGGFSQALSSALQDKLNISASEADRIANTNADKARAMLSAYANGDATKLKELSESEGIALNNDVLTNSERLTADQKSEALQQLRDIDAIQRDQTTGFGDVPSKPTDMDLWKYGICKKESSCDNPRSNPYQKIGPRITDPRSRYFGDHAYGKYQMMGKNLPEWSQQVLGRNVSISEFMANPDLQEKIFEGKFGPLVEKYGSAVKAAVVWFSGEGGLRNLGRADQLGTTAARYAADFAAAIGGGGIPGGYLANLTKPGLSGLLGGGFGAGLGGGLGGESGSPFNLGSLLSGLTKGFGGSGGSRPPSGGGGYVGGGAPAQSGGGYVAPSGGAPVSGQTYPVTPVSQQIQPVVTTPQIKPVATILVQPKEVQRGSSITVSWSSVGMNSSIPCQVFQKTPDVTTVIGVGNEGTKRVTTNTADPLGTWEFRVECSALVGGSIQQTSSVTVK
ncbi:MAG: hypothetical protein HYS26_02905 [Candidatus Kaiserbacteria bacterium]|nr:MAG: hypothetical protein HYS26_02905 [Candidatus Kaiserbacteria bacterium]